MNDFLQSLASSSFLGVPLTNIALALVTALASYLGMSIGLRFVQRRLQALAARTTNHVDDTVVEVLAGTNIWLLALASALIGVGMLELSTGWNARVGQLWFIAVALQFGVWLTRAIGITVRRYEKRHFSSPTGQMSASGTLLSWSLRTVLWAVVLLAVLSNVGVNITAFVASLGVGGIAIALAVQNILGDLFASLSIAVDKPFEVGDFIGVESVVGTVQYVGLKTTRIRSLNGEQVIISNTDLLKQVVKNYRRMEERRIVFQFGVTYDTTPEQAEAIPQVVKRLVEGNPVLRFDRAHFLKFGDSSLDYEVVYIVQDPGYNVYMDAQQALNLGLMRELKALGVAFAFPTRTVYVVSGEEPATEAAMSGDGDRDDASSGFRRPNGPPSAS